MDANLDERIRRIEVTTGLINENTRKWAETQAVMLEGFGQMLELQRELGANVVKLIPLVLDIHEACTAEHPPSALVEPVNQLALAIGEQTTRLTAALENLTDAVREQPDVLREVIRQEMTTDPDDAA